MAERAWIWRKDDAEPGTIRKPRPSIVLHQSRKTSKEPIVPPIPEEWRQLSSIDPDVLALFRQECLGTPRGIHRRIQPAYLVQPFSLQWFHAAERLRYGGPGYWLARVLEFHKHSGETLLCLGKGLGSDWIQFARHGANICVCSPSRNQLQLVSRNFALRGLPVRLQQGSWTHLPYDSEVVDVVHLDGLLHEVDNPVLMLKEIYRVLKPGGKVVAVVPARPRRWQNIHDLRPLLAGLGSRELVRLFHPDFIELKRYRRHVRRRDLWWGYRWLPRPWLERHAGRLWIVKAFKPIASLPQAQKLAA